MVSKVKIFNTHNLSTYIILQGLNIPIIQVPKLDADSLITSYVVAIAKAGIDVAVVSEDKHFYPLLDNRHVSILNIRGNTWMTDGIYEYEAH